MQSASVYPALFNKQKEGVRMTNEDMTVMLTKHSEEISSLKHRVNDVEELIHATNELAMSVRELTVNVANNSNQMERFEDRLRVQGEHYEERLKAQGQRIGELEKKPAKRWDLLVTTILTALASGLVGYTISNFFR